MQQLPVKTATELHRVAQRIGVEEKTLLDRAVRYYLASIKKEIEMKREFDAWDALSDNVLLDFEASVG